MHVYRAVLRAPRTVVLATGLACGRVGFAASALALVLLVHDRTGEFGEAGIALAAFAAGAGLLAPLRGRLLDRFGVNPLLAAFALAHAAALIALAVTPVPEAGALALAAAAGVTAPPVAGTARRSWSALVEPSLLRAAYGLDAVLAEVALVAGPLIAAGLASISPPLALVAAALLVLVGAALVGLAPSESSERGTAVEGAQPLRRGPLARLVLSATVAGVGLGALEVVLPALGASEGSAASSGLFFAVMAAASGAGGLLYGAWRRSPKGDVAYAAALLATGAGLAPLALVSTLAGALPLAALAGAAVAPSWIALYELLDDVVPRGRSIEALAWITGGQAGGIALGGAVAGWLAPTGPTPAALALPSIGFALGALVVAPGLVGRRSPRGARTGRRATAARWTRAS